MSRKNLKIEMFSSDFCYSKITCTFQFSDIKHMSIYEHFVFFSLPLHLCAETFWT